MTGTKPERRANVVDAHVHVIDPQLGFTSGRRYTPGAASAEMLSKHMRALGVGHVVIVQASPHGTDNTALLNALRKLGPHRSSGVGALEDGATVEHALELAASGVVALRINMPDEDLSRTAARTRLLNAAHLALSARLHLELLLRPEDLDLVTPSLVDDCGVPVVLEHFAGLDAEAWEDAARWNKLVALLDTGRVWVKLSRIDRIVGRGPYDVAKPLLDGLIGLRPDRLVWGSDWPHSPNVKRSPDARPLAMLFRSVDDERAAKFVWHTIPQSERSRILSTNPTMLYRIEKRAPEQPHAGLRLKPICP